MLISPHPALSRFVARLQFSSSLSAEEHQAIMGLKTEVVPVTNGLDLVSPGDTIEQSTLVAAGHIGRFDLMSDGTRQITAIYMAGDMCDLYSLVAPTTGWGLTSLGGSTVLQVSHTDLRKLAATYPNLAFAFWRDTVLDASILSKWVANIGHKAARQRIAHLLCELGTRMERADLGAQDDYALALTQDHIGAAVGLTAVHVNRILRILNDEGLATVRRRRVTIHNWQQLTEIAEFTPDFLLCKEGLAVQAVPAAIDN